MTLKEFKVLAGAMGADVVYEHTPGALFKGPKFTVMFEMDNDQLEEAKPVEVAYMLAGFQMYN